MHISKDTSKEWSITQHETSYKRGLKRITLNSGPKQFEKSQIYKTQEKSKCNQNVMEKRNSIT